MTPAQVAAKTGTAEATTAAILLGEGSIGTGQVAGLARTLGVIPPGFFADRGGLGDEIDVAPNRR